MLAAHRAYGQLQSESPVAAPGDRMEFNKPQQTVAAATRTTNYEGGEAFEPADPLSVHPFRLGHLAVRVGRAAG